MGQDPLPPHFPPPGVTERVSQLGYGSGPWSRDQLVTRWNEKQADRFIFDAKAAGWLVSPARGIYHVPPAADLMVVPWLEEPLRQEFLVSRTLASAGKPGWCLSAWCRDRGLLLPGPLFVVTPWRDVGPRAARDLQLMPSLPFLENLLIVPDMPPFEDGPIVRRYLVPETETAQQRRVLSTGAGIAATGLVWLAAAALGGQGPTADDVERLSQRLDAGRELPYPLGPDPRDEAWVLALLTSLGIGRLSELVLERAPRLGVGGRDRIADALRAFGPPERNSDWQRIAKDARRPFLLVPPMLWQEMGPDQAARRLRTLDALTGGG